MLENMYYLHFESDQPVELLKASLDESARITPVFSNSMVIVSEMSMSQMKHLVKTLYPKTTLFFGKLKATMERYANDDPETEVPE